MLNAVASHTWKSILRIRLRSSEITFLGHQGALDKLDTQTDAGPFGLNSRSHKSGIALLVTFGWESLQRRS